MSKRDFNAGLRRVLYDAMVLSASLRAIRESKYYKHRRASDIDGYVEAHQVNALVQIRSMIDFLNCSGSNYVDTMTVIQFFGCTKQQIKFDERGASNKYAAHKSWDAVAKNPLVGAKFPTKPKIIELGLKVLEGFDDYWKQCWKHLAISLNPYARQYKKVLDENVSELKRKGV